MNRQRRSNPRISNNRTLNVPARCLNADASAVPLIPFEEMRLDAEPAEVNVDASSLTPEQRDMVNSQLSEVRDKYRTWAKILMAKVQQHILPINEIDVMTKNELFLNTKLRSLLGKAYCEIIDIKKNYAAEYKVPKNNKEVDKKSNRYVTK